MTSMTDLRAIAAVLAERARQDAKWGEQNHPDGTGPIHSLIGGVLAFIPPKKDIDNASAADAATARTDEHARVGGCTWEDILTEEVLEAAACEQNSPELREEVVQTTAVGIGWLGAMERREVATPRRVYVSGPIAGRENAREAFAKAAAEIDSWGGYEAVNPFDVAPLSHPGEACAPGYHPGDGEREHTSSACFMRTDLLALLTCDAIYMLPGWKNSRGATVEHAVALACGMYVWGAAS